MSETGFTSTFLELINRLHFIEVPLIQRDYAQGRRGEEEVRNSFIQALHDALMRDPDEGPLSLDFVYGATEIATHQYFLPLDGQQRLTTLFLLHWYLAWHDESLHHFRQHLYTKGQCRFTYRVRPSSSEFFDALGEFHPLEQPSESVKPSDIVKDQQWFFVSWMHDPSIQSACTMLDALHERFLGCQSLYQRLIDTERPAITFQVLPLENFGLTDDLYIKMECTRQASYKL